VQGTDDSELISIDEEALFAQMDNQKLELEMSEQHTEVCRCHSCLTELSIIFNFQKPNETSDTQRMPQFLAFVKQTVTAAVESI